MAQARRILVALTAALAAGTWAAPTAQAAPTRDSPTTWTTDFPFASSASACENAKTSTTCSYSATANRDGTADLIASWSSNPAPGEASQSGSAYGVADIGGYVSVPNGATKLTVSTDVRALRDLSASATLWAHASVSQRLYALPPGCSSFTCGQSVGTILVSSTPVESAPTTLPAGTTTHQDLVVTAPAGQTLEKGYWNIRTRLYAVANNAQDQPLQEAQATGAADVTAMTVTVTVPSRH